MYITKEELSDAFLSWLEAKCADSSAKVIGQTDVNNGYDFGIFVAFIGAPPFAKIFPVSFTLNVVEWLRRGYPYNH